SVNLDLEGLLAKAEGTLLNMVEKEGQTRLLIQTADSAFEVNVEAASPDARKQLEALERGSRLAVTGVYEVQSDEYGNPRSFLLHMRSWRDVRLLQLPPWWNLTRLVWVLLGVLAISVIALVWGILNSRKNRLLRQAQSGFATPNHKPHTRLAGGHATP